ncbi:hypothetical protein [Rhodococcus spongiicola]|nr:hypothetical protein [Rhodococcus spongiicola]
MNYSRGFTGSDDRWSAVPTPLADYVYTSPFVWVHPFGYSFVGFSHLT